MSTVSRDTRAATPTERGVLLSPEDEDRIADLFEHWERLSESTSILQPISPLALSLLSLDENSSRPGRALARIIESDPILTARMLGLANSVAFAGSAKPIFKVSDAIVRLGVDTVLTAAFAQLAAKWLRGTCKFPDPALMQELWFEYLITAHCAREIAKRLPEGEVDRSLAYAAGLLHDVGTIALTCVEPALMFRFMRSGYAIDTPLHARFVSAHTQLGAVLLRRWRTPEEIATIAARHHAKSVYSESLVSITVFLADHLHEAVLEHNRAAFDRPQRSSTGCFGGATEAITAALSALRLEDELEAMIARVADESRAIEILAAAVYSE